MATAHCQNEDCKKGSWTLTKEPHQYKRGGPTCPECGTTRVRVEGAQQAQKQAQPPQAVEQAPQGGQGHQPAPAQQQGQQGGLPTTEEAMAGGMQVGNILAGMQSDDPQKKATASGKALKMAGTAVAQLGDHYEKEAVERNQRAKQATNEDLNVSTDYPECPECGGQIRNIPSGEFRCRHCQVVLEYSR